MKLVTKLRKEIDRYFLRYSQKSTLLGCYSQVILLFSENENFVRRLIYDILYSRNTRSHIMLTTILDSWSDMFINPGDATDIFYETIIWTIFNSGPGTSLTDMKVIEVKEKLKNLCKISRPQIQGDEIIKYIVKVVEMNHTNPTIQFYARKSLLLISRTKEYTWSHNHILTRLFQVFQSNSYTESENEEIKAKILIKWVVETLGCITRVFPVDARKNIEEIFEAVKSLIVQDDVTADLENACIRGLIWTGHHLQLQVCKFLATWKPRFVLKAETETLICNFVGTRATRFSQKTVDITRKAQARNKRNRVKN